MKRNWKSFCHITVSVVCVCACVCAAYVCNPLHDWNVMHSVAIWFNSYRFYYVHIFRTDFLSLSPPPLSHIFIIPSSLVSSQFLLFLFSVFFCFVHYLLLFFNLIVCIEWVCKYVRFVFCSTVVVVVFLAQTYCGACSSLYMHRPCVSKRLIEQTK